MLGPEAFAPITVLWTIHPSCSRPVFVPMEQLARSGGSRRRSPSRLPAGCSCRRSWSRSSHRSAFSAFTLDRLLDGNVIHLAVIMVVIAAYGSFALARGALAGPAEVLTITAGRRWPSRWYVSSWCCRLAVGAGAWSAWRGQADPWSPGGLFSSLAVLGKARPRHPDRRRELGAALATFIVANAASQTIVAAGPQGRLGTAAERSVFFETFPPVSGPAHRCLQPHRQSAPAVYEDGGAGRSLHARQVVGAQPASPRPSGSQALAAGHWIGPSLVALFLGEGTGLRPISPPMPPQEW